MIPNLEKLRNDIEISFTLLKGSELTVAGGFAMDGIEKARLLLRMIDVALEGFRIIEARATDELCFDLGHQAAITRQQINDLAVLKNE